MATWHMEFSGRTRSSIQFNSCKIKKHFASVIVRDEKWLRFGNPGDGCRPNFNAAHLFRWEEYHHFRPLTTAINFWIFSLSEFVFRTFVCELSDRSSEMNGREWTWTWHITSNDNIIEFTAFFHSRWMCAARQFLAKCITMKTVLRPFLSRNNFAIIECETREETHHFEP